MERTKYLSTFYLLLFYSSCYSFMIPIINKEIGINIPFFPTSKLVYLLFSIVILGIFIITIIYPVRLLRITGAIFYCTSVYLFAYLHNSGIITHEYFPIMISVVFMCFMGTSKERNLLILRMIQSSLLCHYFISGLWKIRNLDTIWSIDYLARTMFDHMVGTAISTNRGILAMELFSEPHFLLGLGYAGVILFEITAILPIFFNRLFFAYGVMAILFHLSTAVFAGTYSVNTLSLIIFFLLWCEVNFPKKEPRQMYKSST